MTRKVIAISGGKDSVSMALRLAELNPGAEFDYLITPTGNETPDVFEHWQTLEATLGAPLTVIKPAYAKGEAVVEGCHVNGSWIVGEWENQKVKTPSGKTKRIRVCVGAQESDGEGLETWEGDGLLDLIHRQQMIPNFRARWCTRQLKIEPIICWLVFNSPVIQFVGLRADEEKREGLYGSIEGVETSYPLRDWGWGLEEVWRYLDAKGIGIPERTDCALCFFQRLIEWRRLHKNNESMYRDGEEIEAAIGHTFRSGSRDTWPASLAGLRAEWEAGRRVKGESAFDQRMLFDCDREALCRVCSM